MFQSKHCFHSIFILLFLCLPNYSFAQFEAKKVPRSERKTIQKLTNYLCEGAESDSAKVVEISSWIISNIKYDYKLLVSRKWDLSGKKNILKRKKGLCGDFADLFNEMCLSQGIPSQKVIGYTKGFSYEPFDSLYLAEHAWNVAKVDGNWKPLDLSWSVGYTKQRKQWLRRMLYFYLGIPYRIKYKFINELNDRYFLISPEEFMQTHAPLQERWQLLNRPVPIQYFEMDSVASYIARYSKKEFQTFNYGLEIQRYLRLDEREKFLNEGKLAKKYNPKNHRIVGLSYMNFGNDLLNDIPTEDVEEVQLKLLDSCLNAFDSALTYFDLYRKDLKALKRNRKVRHDEFKRDLLKVNKLGSKLVKNTQRSQKRLAYQCKTSNNKHKSKISRLKRYEKQNEKKDIFKVERSKSQTEKRKIKIAQLKTELKQNDSTLYQKNLYDFSKEKLQIEVAEQQIKLLDSNILFQIKLTTALAKNAKIYRFYYNNYTKPALDSLKDSIIHSHNQSDYLLDCMNENYEIAFSAKDSLIRHYNVLIDLYLKRMKLFEKLKKTSRNDNQEDQSFIGSKHQMLKINRMLQLMLDTLIGLNNDRIKQMKSYESYFRRTAKLLTKEKEREYKRFYMKKRWYSRQYVIYKRQSERLKYMTNKSVRECKYSKTVLEKQIKKRELASKKNDS